MVKKILLMIFLLILFINLLKTINLLQKKVDVLESEIYKTENIFGSIRSYNLLERLSEIVCEHEEKLGKRISCP